MSLQVRPAFLRRRALRLPGAGLAALLTALVLLTPSCASGGSGGLSSSRSLISRHPTRSTSPRRHSARTTRSEADLIAMRTKSRGKGIVLGAYDETDTPLELTVKYRGRKAEDKRG